MKATPRSEPVQPLLFIVSGPSGAGKKTLMDHIVKDFAGIQRVVTYTTRDPRPNEKAGVDYTFLQTAEFEQLVEQGEIFESVRTYGDHLYGSPRTLIDATDPTPLIAELDVKGMLRIKHLSRRRVVSIFIMPASLAELKRRVVERHIEGNLRERLAVAEQQLQYALAYDYVLHNVEMKDFLDDASAIVQAELVRAKGVHVAIQQSGLNSEL